jgi:hypothetical protein
MSQFNKSQSNTKMLLRIANWGNYAILCNVALKKKANCILAFSKIVYLFKFFLL